MVREAGRTPRIVAETIYESNQRARKGWLASFREMTHDCIESQDLIQQLFKRDWLMMYKKSFLGMGWHLAAPIMGIFSWVLMNATGVLEPGDVGIPYPAYVLISTAIWGFFVAAFTQTSQVLEIAKSFIHQVGFQHHVLIVNQWLQTLVNFGISLAVTLIVMGFMGVFPSPLVFLFPLALLPILFLGSAIGLITAVIQVVAPDIKRGVTFLMGFWMYITPVIYSPKVESPFLQAVIYWNPMTYLLGGARDLFVSGAITQPDTYGVAAGVSVLVFLVVLRVFYISEEKVIEKMI